MQRMRGFIRLVAAFGLLAACSSETTSGSTTGAGTTVTTTSETTSVATTSVTTTSVTTTSSGSTVTTTTIPAPADQLAIWPAAGVVFASPETAAADFMANALPKGTVLGPYRAGDQRSGEIEVFASEEAGTAIGAARSTLLLRQLGDAGGWFVLAAVSEFATISQPGSGATVADGPVTIKGVARGFEASIGLKAFVVGKAKPVLAQTSTMAGNFDQVLPYTVTLDLSAASPGDVVVLLVHGGVGLETDPGDFSAIPVRIAG